MGKYELEKKIWNETDFEKMGWHDCRIYKIRLTDNLELDIDYILQWNKPDIEGLPFTFWVAPATLVFKKISNIQFEIDTAFDEAVEIEDIELSKSDYKLQDRKSTRSELQSRENLVCRLLLEKKNKLREYT